MFNLKLLNLFLLAALKMSVFMISTFGVNPRSFIWLSSSKLEKNQIDPHYHHCHLKAFNLNWKYRFSDRLIENGYFYLCNTIAKCKLVITWLANIKIY